jgi:hypothetical protein
MIGSQMRATRSAASQLKTVGILVGPPRNFATLTATISGLHPECCAFDQAGERFFSPRRDFLTHYSDKRLRAFCAGALKESCIGPRTRVAHHFDRFNLQSLDHDRLTKSAATDPPTCLVWKDPLLATTRIRSSDSSIIELLDSAPKLRFILPIRNPLDCAISNLRNSHMEGAEDIAEDRTRTLARILEMISWVAALEVRHPDRFLTLFQDDTPEKVAGGLLRLLSLRDDPQWRDSVGVAFKIHGNPYTHGPEMYDAFESGVESYFRCLPGVASRLKALVGEYNPQNIRSAG